MPYPKKGGLGLAELYELCESIDAWLRSDRDNVAVVHCAVCGPVCVLYASRAVFMLRWCVYVRFVCDGYLSMVGVYMCVMCSGHVCMRRQ